MHVEFSEILAALTLITGAIWALDAVFWAPRRRALQADQPGQAAAGETQPQKTPLIVEYARSFFPVILIVLLVRSFVVEPFRIPSGSMIPTLLVGDFILVNKFDYGIRLPVIDKKIISVGEPERGDVVVFRYPEDPSVDYIKRVIGLPGDHIAYYNKILYINGKPVPEKLLGTYHGRGAEMSMSGAQLWQEQLGRARHDILIEPWAPSASGQWVVPKGEYFVMGDNRDNSNDSRYWGFVPDKNLVGKAFVIWLNWDWEKGGVTWSRIGDRIR